MPTLTPARMQRATPRFGAANDWMLSLPFGRVVRTLLATLLLCCAGCQDDAGPGRSDGLGVRDAKAADDRGSADGTGTRDSVGKKDSSSGKDSSNLADGAGPRDASIRADMASRADGGRRDGTVSPDLGARHDSTASRDGAGLRDAGGTRDGAGEAGSDLNDYSSLNTNPPPDPSCAAPGFFCDSNIDCCGYTATPRTAGCYRNTCAALCDVRADCVSQCCYVITGPGGVCQPAAGRCLPAIKGSEPNSYDGNTSVTGSGCKVPGQACTDNIDCCGYTATPRLAGCSRGPGGVAACSAICSQGTDCRSGCCRPLAGSTDAVCQPFDLFCM